MLCAEVLESPPSSRVPYPPRQYRNEENGHKVSLLFSYIYIPPNLPVLLSRRKYNEQTSRDDIDSKIATMSNLRWSEFAVPVFEEAVAAIKKETQHIGDLLHRHKDFLAGKASSMRKIRSGSKKKVVRGTVAAFSNALNPVQISDDEFYAVIDSGKKSSRPKGKG